MNTRKYLAELLGTFLFMTIGYLSVAAVAADAVPASARRPVLVRLRPARRDLRVRACLGRTLQPGRHGGRGRRRPDEPDGRRRLHHPRRSSARSARPRWCSSPSTRRRSPLGSRAGPGRHRCRGTDHRDGTHRRVRRGHPRRDAARDQPGRPGHPPDTRRDPLRLGDAERRVGQPGAVDRLGAGRWRRRHSGSISSHPSAGSSAGGRSSASSMSPRRKSSPRQRVASPRNDGADAVSPHGRPADRRGSADPAVLRGRRR